MKTAPDLRDIRESWQRILDRRKLDNGGRTVRTDRGDELVFTIQATERDLDDLVAFMEAEAKTA